MRYKELGLDGYDWGEAFEYANKVSAAIPGDDVSRAPFTREDVAEVIALVEGENDGDNWVVAGRLDDGRWFVLRAGCDYTGWDCQADGDAEVACSRDDLLRYGISIQEAKRLGLESP